MSRAEAHPPANPPAGTAGPAGRVRVWDRFVRVFHWSLVACFFGAYFTTVGFAGAHEVFGYAALALVVARSCWGFAGRGHARFDAFVPGPRRLVRYLAAMLRGREPRHLGHNPAAAVMIVFLIVTVGAIGATGWMLTLDAFWGNESVEDLHVLLVDVVLVAVALHVCAAIYESWRHRENLILSMVTGTKRADPGSARHGSGVQ